MSGSPPQDGSWPTPHSEGDAVGRFDQAWHVWCDGPEPRLDDFLPADGGPSAGDAAAIRELLTELIKVDMEYRCRRGLPLASSPGASGTPGQLVEGYLARYPGLHLSGADLIALLGEEYRDRHRWGDRPGHDTYVSRFPDLDAASLRRELVRIDAVLQATVLTSPLTTPVSGGQDSFLPGRRLGDYEILAELGRGGMGIVYRARQHSLNREVALKVLREGTQASPEQRTRFFEEAQAAAHLSHPGIVVIHEVGEHEGCPFLAMEYLPAGPWSSLLGRKPQDPRHSAEQVRTLAQAAHHAHSQGILHRDLKPSNVLIAGDGTLKISDLGLAKRLDVQGQASTTSPLVGTLPYMAPEQILGKDITRAVDIYALGAILYELLTGRPPFEGATAVDTIRQIEKHDLVPPRRLNPSVPRDLETICLKCLRRDPRRRYGTAEALAEDLGRFLAGQPIVARPVGRLERAVLWGRRNPTWATAAVLGLVALGALLWSYARVSHAGAVAEEQRRQAVEAGIEADLQRQTAQREAGQNRQRLLRLTVLTGDGHLQEGDLFTGLLSYLDALALDDDGPPDASVHRLRLGVALRQCPRLLQVWSSPHPVSHVEMSPDGDLVLATYLDGSARVWTAATGEPRFAQPLRHQQAILHAAFSPDSHWVITGSSDHTARVWSAVDGSPRGKPFGLEQPVVHVAFHPQDSDKVLAVSGVRFDRTRWINEPGVPRVQMIPGPRGPNGVMQMIPQYIPGTPMTRQEQPLGVAQMWDLRGGKEVGPGMDLDGWLEHGVFSPDGRLVAIAGGSEEHDNEVQVWGWADARQVGKALVHDAHVHHVAFSPDGLRLVTATGQPGDTHGEARVWDVRGSAPLARPLKHDAAVVMASFSPDGRRVLTASHDRTARLWDAASGDPLTPPLAHREALVGAWLSPDGRSVLTASRDGAARVWDAATSRPLTPWLRHRGPVTCAAFSGDGRRLLTGGEDGVVRLWDLAGPAHARPAFYHQRKVVPPDAHVTRTERINGDDEVIFRSRTNEGDVVVGAAVVTPGGGHVLTAAGTHVREVVVGGAQPHTGVRVDTFALCLWDAAGGLRARIPHDLPVAPALVSPDGTTLVTVAHRGPADVAGVRLWDLATAGVKGHLPLHQGERVMALAFTPQGRCLRASLLPRPAPAGTRGGRTYEIAILDVADGKAVAALPLEGRPELVAFGADARQLVVVTLDADRAARAPRWSARVWDLEADRPLGPPLSHDRLVTRALLGPGGRRLLTWGTDLSEHVLDSRPARDARPDRSAWLWELHPDGEGVSRRLPHADAITSASFSSDGQWVVTTSADRTARVWSAADGGEVTRPLEHGGRVNHAAFGPGGLLATASADGTVCLWHVPTGERVAPPFPHRAEVLHVAFAGDHLLTSGGDGAARWWDLSPTQRSPAELQTLVQALGGRTRGGVGGVSALDAASLSTAWERTRGQFPAQHQPRPDWALAWHWDQADDAERGDDWHAVVLHAQRLLEDSPEDTDLHVRLARAHARLEHWASAEQSYARAVHLGADDPMLEYVVAVLQVQQQRLEAYRHTCKRLLGRFVDTADPGVAQLVARACTLGPGAVDDYTPVLCLAEKGIKGSVRETSSAGRAILGALLYRAGRCEEAIAHLSGPGRYLGGGDRGDALFLALAQDQLGRPANVSTILEQTTALLAERPLSWLDRLPLLALKAELEGRK